VAILKGHEGPVGCLAFCPDGKVLASGGIPGSLVCPPPGADYNRTVRLWSVPDGTPLRTLNGHKGSVACFAISPDGKLLASAGSDGSTRRWQEGHTVRLWYLPYGEHSKTLDVQGRVRCLAFSPDGNVLAIGCSDGVQLWTVPDGKVSNGLEVSVQCLAFTPDGRVLVVGGCPIRMWSVAGGEALKTIEHGSFEVTSLAISPDGGVLACGGRQQVKLWRLPDGEPLCTLDACKDLLPSDCEILNDDPRGIASRQVTSLVFSPDSRVLVSGGEDETVRLWSVPGGKPLKTLEHKSRVYCLAISPDGRVLASGGMDSVVRLWTWKLLHLSQSRAGRTNWWLEFMVNLSRWRTW
jgi:WD40 repeat protein